MAGGDFHSKAANCRIDAHLLKKLIPGTKEVEDLKRMIAILNQAAQVYDQMARSEKKP